MSNFDLILRHTEFSQEIIINLWDDLNTGQRVELLLYLKSKNIGLGKPMVIKIARDKNPVVRMLGIKDRFISKDKDPELYLQLMNDPSPLVRSIMKGMGFFFNERDFWPMSHIERLGVIALNQYISEKAFATFISEGLGNKTLSEEEAEDLVVEFVRNPWQVRGIERETSDGLDAYTMHENFKAIWNLTTCTPWIVHKFIAEEFPLWMGGDDLFSRDTFPDEMFDRMSTEALKAVAFRQHKPLLKQLKIMPEKFTKEIHKNARFGAELEEERKQREQYQETEIELLKKELHEFRAEVRECLKSLSQKVSEALTKRRGFF